MGKPLCFVEQCGPGYFYVSSMDACSECGFGSYNNLAGKKSCITCPGQTSTRIRGAPDVSYCIGKFLVLLTLYYAILNFLSLLLDHCFDDGFVGKQPVALEEFH